MMRDMKGGEYRRVEVLTGPGRRRVWDEATKGKRGDGALLPYARGA
jgi:transposase